MKSPSQDIAALAARFVNNTHRHVFLTGKAGTGKTTFLRYITGHTHKQAVIAAPTGVAAINAGGITLHSLFQLPFGAYVPAGPRPTGFSNAPINDRESLVRGLQIRGNKRRLLQELELLIIDEVSMLRADLLDAISTVLQVVRRRGQEPFGGLQVLFIGDLLQLPPVVKDQEWQVLRQFYPSPFFFDAQCLQAPHQPLYLELDKVYRQTDNTFISLLNNLRHNRLLPEDAERLNRHYRPGFRAAPGDAYIQLTTHNHKADAINREALQQLPGQSYYFKAELDKDFPEHMYPLEETLELKPEAQVMFIKNDMSGEKRFYNGKIGRVSAIDAAGFEVTFPDEDDAPVKVERHEWQNIRYRFNEVTNEVEEEVLGTFRQYPVRLAWSITIHKSQGLTFQKAILDLGSAFAPGQVYVALSRLVSLEGLVLCSPVPTVLPSQDRAISGFADAQGQEPLEEVLETESQTYLKRSLLACFDFAAVATQLRVHLSGYYKGEQRSARQQYLPWAQALEAAFRKERDVAEKFRRQLERLTQQQPLDLEALEARVRSATDYFRPLLKEMSRTVLHHLGQVAEEKKKTKQYQAELVELESYFFRQVQLLDKAGALITSFREGRELTRQDVGQEEDAEGRLDFIVKTRSPRSRKTKDATGKSATAPKTPGQKVSKGQTQEESYRLYRDGHTVEEIAALRSLAPTTIEGHLARYVTSGDIPVETFLDPAKLEPILTVARTLDTTQLSPIKELLGEEYTYADIRFAMAYKQLQDKGED